MANGILQDIGQGLQSFIGQVPLSQIQEQSRQREQQKQQDFLALDKQRQGALFQDAQAVNTFLKAGQTGKALDTLSNRAGIIEQIGGDSSDTREIADFIARGDIKGAQSLLDSVETVGIQQGFLKPQFGTNVSVQSAKILDDGTIIEVLKSGGRRVIS